MAEHHSNRRCPNCGCVGRMFRSHSRNRFEKIMHLFSALVYKYRCHQCNWRGYMFRKFPSQKRPGFYLTIASSLAAFATAMFALIKYFTPQIVATMAR